MLMSEVFVRSRSSSANRRTVSRQRALGELTIFSMLSFLIVLISKDSPRKILKSIGSVPHLFATLVSQTLEYVWRFGSARVCVRDAD